MIRQVFVSSDTLNTCYTAFLSLIFKYMDNLLFRQAFNDVHLYLWIYFLGNITLDISYSFDSTKLPSQIPFSFDSLFRLIISNYWCPKLFSSYFGVCISKARWPIWTPLLPLPPSQTLLGKVRKHVGREG